MAAGLTCATFGAAACGGDGAGPVDAGHNSAVDAGPRVDAASAMDVESVLDADLAADAGSMLDADLVADAGSMLDADLPADTGWGLDAESATDAEPGTDAGAALDAASDLDAAPADGAPALDAGPTSDAGNALDAGLESDAGGIDLGPLTEAAANPGQWTWVPVPGAICRDGSATGVGVRLKPNSRRLTIFLFGGGACFNRETCGSNPSRFGSPEFQQFAGYYGGAALFDERDLDNPLFDDSFAVVGYCTGDVHAGVKEDVAVAGVSGLQQFVGGRNLDRFLAILTPYFSGRLDRVLLTGFSAGGFGSIFSYHRVADAFAPVVVDMVDDSGPVMRDPTLNPPCLVDLQNDLWGISLGASTCSACQNPGLGAVLGFYDHLVSAYPEARFGMISSLQDSTIRYFLSYGANGCTTSQDPGGTRFQAGLEDLRDGLFAPTGRWSTFFIPGASHVAYFDFEQAVGGVPLKDWLGRVIDGQVVHVSP